MIPFLHVGTGHLWDFAPAAVFAGLVVFLGALALRSRLQRWVEEPDEGDEGKPD